MSFSILKGKLSVSVLFSVLLTTLVVALVTHSATYINTSSVGAGTSTPGGALGVKGYADIEGFVSADYYTSTSTNPSWIFGRLGIGTTTPGAALSVRGDNGDVAGNLTVESQIKTSFLTATSTTATSTLSSYGSSLASTTITIDGQSGRMAIGSTSVPTAAVANTQAVDPALTIQGQGAAASATGTLYISGGGANGGQIIVRSSNGTRCVSIMANTGANALDASGLGSADLLTFKVVACPK